MTYDREINNFVLRPNTSVLEAMQKLNTQPHGQQFVIIVDIDHNLLGTLTDGDVRRAILSGRLLAGSVSDFMCETPIFGRDYHPPQVIQEKLGTVSSANPFLPIVDECGRLVGVKIKTNDNAVGFDALVLAGGFGKRLGQLTKNKPKPLLHARGKPLLEHVLSNLEQTSVNNIFVATHYLADQIHAFLVNTNRDEVTKLIHEKTPLGTAGAIGLLPSLQKNNLIVTNSDIVTELNFESILKYHIQSNFDATVAVATHKINIPFGVVRFNAEGRFDLVDEKPVISNYVAAGVYCLKPSFYELVGQSEVIDMPTLLEKGKNLGLSVGVFPLHEEWLDVGRPEDFEASNSCK